MGSHQKPQVKTDNRAYGATPDPVGAITCLEPSRQDLFVRRVLLGEQCTELAVSPMFVSHQKWVRRFLAQPSLLGLADSYGIELIHPRRQGRSDKQIGKKGLSNQRWTVGAKLYFLLNHLGQVVDFTCLPANVHDSDFPAWIAVYEGQRVVFGDPGFHTK